MENEAGQIREKLNSVVITPFERVNLLNQLAVSINAKAPAEALKLSLEAAEQAASIGDSLGEADALLHAGVACYTERKFDEAENYYKKALSAFEKLNDDPKKGAVLARLGNLYLHLGRYSEALEQYDEAIVIREKLNDEQGAADVYANSGTIRLLQGNYSLALKNYLLALKIFENLNAEVRVATTCLSIGTVYKQQGNYSEALRVYARVLAIREKYDDRKAISEVMNNMGNVYFEQGKHSEALSMHGKALQLREEIGDKSRLATSYSNLADVYKATGEYAVSLEYYNKAVTLFEELNEKRGLVPTYFNIGELYYMLGDNDNSERFFDNAITIAEQTGLRDYLRETYQYKAKLSARKNDFQEAYRLHLRYSELDKEISNAESSRQIAEMTVQHQIEHRERETELEREKNAELTKAFNSLEEEKKRSESLLLNILPEEVAEELKQTGQATAKFYDNVTVLFTDFVGFTRVSMLLTPQQLVDELHECFKGFDNIISKYAIEKIKTVGDAYLAASGLPTPNPQHAVDVIKAAIEIRDFMLERRKKLGDATFDVRLGIHSGSVVAGIVGVTKFAYDIWGDAVNTAARMEQNSIPGKINVSETTYQLVAADTVFSFEARGSIEAKNKGMLNMYFVC